MKKIICYLSFLLLAEAAYSSPLPSLEVKVNIKSWLASYSETTTSNKTCATINELGISTVAVSLFPDAGTPFAVAKIKTSLQDAQTTWLSNTNLPQLIKVADHEFLWKPSGTNYTAFPMCNAESMRIRFDGNTVLIADSNRFNFAESMVPLTNINQLVKGSIQVASLLTPLWEAADKGIERQKKSFSKQIMRSILKSAKKQIALIQDIPSITIIINAISHDTRTATLELDFKTPEYAENIISSFNNADTAWKDPSITEKQLSLYKLVNTPYFREITNTHNTLRVSYEWPSEDDHDAFKLITGSIFGNLFSFRNPNSFPTNEEEIMQPVMFENIAKLDLKQIEADIRSSLFLEHLWGNDIDLTIDQLSIPNIDLITGTLTDVHITSTNGTDITHSTRPGSFGYNPDTKNAGINLHSLKGDQKADKASFTLTLDVPVKIEQFTLSKDNPLNERDGKGLCLLSISNSIIHLRSKDISLFEVNIYALNKKGNFLKSSSSSTSQNHSRREYKGIPSSVKVVYPVKTETVVIKFKDLSVNKESILKLPHSPTNTITTRYTTSMIKEFSNPDMEAIAGTSIILSTNTTPSLSFSLPPHTKTEKVTLQSYLAGTKEFMYRGHSGGYSTSDNKITWTLTHTNPLNKASAIFGQAEFILRTGVSTHSTDVSTNETPFIPGQDLPSASVKNNAVWIKNIQEGKSLDIQAFDSTGHQLKKDNNTNSNGKKTRYLFWGFPAHIAVTYSTSHTNIIVPFEIELKQGGLNKIAAVREKIPPLNNFISEVKEISRQTRHYGTLLSGSYYADRKSKSRISEEVAHSDPAGVKIFGYELTPYKGYYIQRIPYQDDLKEKLKLKQHKWSGGSFESTGYSGTGALLATPVNNDEPTILVRWSSPYINYNDCSKVTVIPNSTYKLKKSGWIELN